MAKACLNCGGLGARKEYENVAGDYHWTHCVLCDGTGRENLERIEHFRRVRADAEKAEAARNAAAPWWYRWLL